MKKSTLDQQFDAYYPAWSRDVSKDRAYNVRSSWKKHRPFGDTPIDEISAEEATRFFHDLELGARPKAETLRRCRKLADRAIAEGTASRNPFASIEIRKERKGARRPKHWAPEEVAKLRGAGDQDQRDAIDCAYYGAMRASDIRRLRWENIDFSFNTVTFHDTKSGRIETIAMVPDLREALLERHRREGEPSEGYVFPAPNGGELPRVYDWDMNDLIEEAGVEKRGRKLHAFRHAAAVHAASGVWGEKWSKEEVSKLLRDTSDAVDVYFDITAESMQTKALGVRPMKPRQAMDASARLREIHEEIARLMEEQVELLAAM